MADFKFKIGDIVQYVPIRVSGINAYKVSHITKENPHIGVIRNREALSINVYVIEPTPSIDGFDIYVNEHNLTLIDSLNLEHHE